MSQETDRVARFRSWALQVLQRLGNPPQQQLAFIERTSVGTDELILEFDDVLSTASGLFHDELLTLEEFDTLRRVDAATVVVCAADESIWTEVALTGATEWSELRKVANSVKLELAESWNLGDYL